MGLIIGILLFLATGGLIVWGCIANKLKKVEQGRYNRRIYDETDKIKTEFERKHTGWNSTPATEEENEEYQRRLQELDDKLDKSKNVFGKMLILLGCLCFALFMFIPFSIHQVDAGEVAVVKVWGDAKDVKTAGIHFDFWLSHKYEKYDIKVQQALIQTQAYSSDGQTMDIELVIQFQIQADKAIDIYKNYGGLEMLENKIETVCTEKMKSVLSQKSAMTIIETRAVVSPNVENAIMNAITNDYYVNITSVVLTDISFTDTFEKVIEDKMVAEQQKLQAEYEKEKAIIQAEQALEVAKLEAEAKLAQAEGEAKAIEQLAQAQANSIKAKSIEIARMLGFTITETATEDGITYDIDFTGKTTQEIKVISDYLKYIEYLEIWNGELPDVITSDSATIMIPTPSV